MMAGVLHIKQSFESWAVRVFSYHSILLRNRRLSTENADLTIQIGGGITIVIPLFVACGITVFLLTPVFGAEIMMTTGMIAVLLIILGAMRITDSLYDNNRNEIRRLVDEIELVSNDRTWWVVGQLLKIYLINIALAAIIIFSAS